MKIRWDVFNGIRPRQSRAKLPPGYGQVATNVRARSGDLESWASPSLEQTLPKAGPITSLFLMARQFFLHFAEDVDFARGPIPAETNDEERTYFTGLDCPRVTTRELATEAFSPEFANKHYPYDSLKLGMPAPENEATVESAVAADLDQTTFADDCSQQGDWNFTNGATVDSSETVAGAPAPVFRLRTDFANDLFDVRASRDMALDGKLKFELEFSFKQERTSADPMLGDPPLRINLFGDESFSSSAQVNVPANFTDEYTLKITGTANSLTSYDLAFELTNHTQATITQLPGIEDVTPAGGWFRINASTVITEIGGGLFGRDDVTVFADEFRIREPRVSTANLNQTVYVYTYLNALNEEGAPSPVSEAVFVGEGIANTVTIPDSGAGNADFPAIGWRLYRAATGATTTAFLLVNETLYGSSVEPEELRYEDTRPDSELEELLQSDNWDIPPEDGHSILALPNGIMVMASKNEVVPSVRFRPHAYPVGFRVPADRNVVTLAALDTTVFALTESHTYQVIGDDPSALSMAKFGPPYACVSKRSVAYLSDIGFLYASPDGLVAGNTQRLWLISEPWITPREWKRDFYPETITAIAHNDIYFGFFDTGTEKRGFVFDPAQDGFGFAPLEIGVDGVHVDPLTDSLYFTQGQDLFLWEGDPTRLTYTWRSRKELLPHPNAFSIAQVDAETYENLTMRFFADGAPYFEKTVTGPEEFRIAPADGRDLEIELEGTDVVHMAEIADDVEELT